MRRIPTPLVLVLFLSISQSPFLVLPVNYCRQVWQHGSSSSVQATVSRGEVLPHDNSKPIVAYLGWVMAEMRPERSSPTGHSKESNDDVQVRRTPFQTQEETEPSDRGGFKHLEKCEEIEEDDHLTYV
ncbi:hypothetical protein FISHEDRAFT_68444 [Fistulina hepatica ATCC 64428]|uniref:Uncharacterized protein n=1 Tax=Fistulina hepatica ATCC 64428 TaxID=1128425 RepID=A0A0D7APT6_9AGAR|nr:hypothetical protein FISHEDRAFT_68444 [Fistulina hepatica ATCC 64428]